MEKSFLMAIGAQDGDQESLTVSTAFHVHENRTWWGSVGFWQDPRPTEGSRTFSFDFGGVGVVFHVLACNDLIQQLVNFLIRAHNTEL